MIEDLKRKGLIDGLKTKFNVDVYETCMEKINGSSFHVDTRNAILMVLVPRHLHVDDESQTAFLRAAVSRVRKLNFETNHFFYSSLQIRQ